MAFDASSRKVDHSAKERQYKKSLVKFTKLLWTMDAETSLEKVCEMDKGASSYMEWLQRSSRAWPRGRLEGSWCRRPGKSKNGQRGAAVVAGA